MRFVLTILLCALVETGTSAVSGSEAGGGDEAQPAWEKPKAPRPKPFRMGRRKIQSAVIKEPKKEQSKVSFPSKSGRSRANSIKWVSKLLQNVARLLISKKRLNNGCRKCRQDWRGKQITAMADNPLYLPFRPVNGSSPPMVTLPIERMSKIKTYNRTIFRAYVDEEAWAAKEWHFFDLGARFFLKKTKRVNLGSTFQFICGYPGAEKFNYHAFDINPLKEGFPSFVKWTTGAIWNDTGRLDIVSDAGAGSHVIFKAGEEVSAHETANGKANTTSVNAVDFAQHLIETVEPEDFVVVKIDVENAEFRVIDKLFSTGAIDLIDEVFIECHGELNKKAYKLAGINGWIPEAWVRSIACINIETRLRKHGIFLHEWD